jgi:hypothetical protein
MLRHSLDDLMLALCRAAAILARPLGGVDEHDYADVLDVLAHFAPVPGYEACFCWLAGCHLTGDERKSTSRLAVEIAVRWDAARAGGASE